MPISGFTRYRKHQVGKQTAFASNVAATRILPYTGMIEVNPNRTDPSVDVGSLDPILAPFAGQAAYKGTWGGNLAFNDAPYLWAGLLKGGVTPTGATAKTWTFQAASLTSDSFEYFTDEWGDDYATDVMVGGSGIIDTLDLSFGADLSAVGVNAGLLYGRVGLGAGFTGGLTIDANPTWVYGADTEVYLDSVYTAIGTTKIVDAIHGVGVNFAANTDEKRFANGSNTRFQLAGYGRGNRQVTVTLTLAKSAASTAEAQTLTATPVPNRYIEIKTTAPDIITGSTPYSQSIRIPCRLISRADGALNNNTTITLVYRGFYDSSLAYAIKTVVVNTLASL